MNTRQHFARGLGAGLLAAAVFAALFLIVDSIQGQPVRTPAYMGTVIFSFADSLPAGARIALFTLVHFAGFAVAGIAMSMLLEAAEITPSVPVGIALGFLIFDLVFYGSVLLLGVDIVGELGWPQVLAGNVLAGAVLCGYLRAKSGLRVLDVRGVLDRSEILRTGLIAGLIGASAVAIWFLIVDVVQGHIFYTPAALGSAVFYGVSDPAHVMMRTSVVLGYTVLHFVAFFAAGLMAAHLMDAAHPPMLLGVALFFITLEVLSLGFLSAVATWLFQTVPWWTPIVANLLAGGGMAWYLWHAHPALHERLTRPLEEDPVTSV